MNEVDKEIFDALKLLIPGIEFLDYFSNGGTSRVFLVNLPIGLGGNFKVKKIIKVARHDLEQDLIIEDVFRNELENLVSISHTNVIGLDWFSALKLAGQAVPFFVMEYLEGARDFDVWLEDQIEELSSDQILEALLQILYGLAALHSAGIVHCDLKPSNVFVGENGVVKIADFGFSKKISHNYGTTLVYATHEYIPQRYRKRLKKNKEGPLRVERSNVDESWDLHFFSWFIRRLLEISEESGDQHLKRADRTALELIADRLDLDKTSAKLIDYDSASAVIADFKKLRSSFLSRPKVPELSNYTGSKTIRIPISGSIPFTDRVRRLVNHPMYLRLHKANQLGFTYQVFPGARHTRFEHSLGVFSNVVRYINALISDDFQPFFRQFADEEKITTTLLAGLLHDIGQHSFAHGLEDLGVTPRHEIISQALISGSQDYQHILGESTDQTIEELIRRDWPEANLDRLFWLINEDNFRG